MEAALRQSITIMIGLEGAFCRDPEVFSLRRRELRELHPELTEMELGHTLIKGLRECINLPDLIFADLRKELDLREDLVREAIAHDEARMDRSASKVHEATASGHDGALAVGADEMVD